MDDRELRNASDNDIELHVDRLYAQVLAGKCQGFFRDEYRERLMARRALLNQETENG